jgi:hypothetical protein
MRKGKDEAWLQVAGSSVNRKVTWGKVDEVLLVKNKSEKSQKEHL